jgi:RNA recognition motif-containing protein
MLGHCPTKEENMGNKLYVGGLFYDTTDKQLEDLFATHGTVESARVITDKFTGRSKGFGFVEIGSCRSPDSDAGA